MNEEIDTAIEAYENWDAKNPTDDGEDDYRDHVTDPDREDLARGT